MNLSERDLEELNTMMNSKGWGIFSEYLLEISKPLNNILLFSEVSELNEARGKVIMANTVIGFPTHVRERLNDF